MTYQSLILGAGNTRHLGNAHFSKCRYLIDEKQSLLDLSVASQEYASKIIVALDPEDYIFFMSKSYTKTIRLLEVSHPTQGALATAGMCLDDLSEGTPIIISAIDGLCPNHVGKFYESMQNSNSDGGAIVFSSDNPSYCYVRVSDDTPIEFAEKRKIGDLASAGVYYFKNKELLVESILWAILNQVKVNDLYYFSSAMNKLIFENRNISLFRIYENDYYRFSSESEANMSLQRLKGS